MEESMTAEERLEQIEKERKELKVRVKDEREKRLEAEKEKRARRDVEIKKTLSKLKLIQSEIYAYNKLGKVARQKNDVLQRISEIVNMDDQDVVAMSSE